MDGMVSTVVILALVGLCTVLAARKLYKDKKNGKSCCGGDCCKCKKCK